MTGWRTSARVLLLLLACAPWGAAQAAPYGPFNRSQDDWKVSRTRNFIFYFTDDTRRTTAYLMGLADATLERLNRFYQVEFSEPITVTVVGNTAYANGFADSVRNRITIMATPANHHSRRRTPWLDNVFTHELSHILSLNRATHIYRRVPLMLGTGVVRAGQVQSLARVPISGRNYPRWFVEGVAQFDTERLGRDSYDENRRAFQRAAFEDRQLFPLGRLAFFGGEAWYNTGFDFLNYLEKRFDAGTVHRLFADYGDHYYPVFDQLFSSVLGVPLSELERDYRKHVAERFHRHLRQSAYGHFDGAPLTLEGVDTPYLSLPPGRRDDLRGTYQGVPYRFMGGRLFYRQAGVLNAGKLSRTGEITEVESLGEGYAIARNGTDSYFVLRQLDEDPSLFPYFYRSGFESASLVLRDAEGEERVLMREARLHGFDVCETRSEMAAVHNDGDGSLRLAMYKIAGFGTPDVTIDQSSQRFVLDEVPFDEVRWPRYGPRCERLYFSRRVGDNHDILALHLQSGRLETVSAEPDFELYPAPGKYGLFFTSARRGAPEVYFKPYAGGPAEPVTLAITGHHYPVPTPAGLVFARRYSTGFQMHRIDLDSRPPRTIADTRLDDARPAHAQGVRVAGAHAESENDHVGQIGQLLARAENYSGFDPEHIVAPSFVPILDVIYDNGFSPGSELRVQGGLELFMEDRLKQHQLLLRGFAGNQSSLLFDYENRMTPLTLRLRAGITDIRNLYRFDSGENSFEHVTDYQWNFIYSAAQMPLNLFYRVGLSAETTRDIGSTLGARDRPYDWWSPRYGRDLIGGFIRYSGLDRSDPLFRERDINRRGYRQFSLRAFYGLERVHPSLEGSDAPLQVGVVPYVRAEFQHTEYISLPSLLQGYFDHTLQVDLQLGYISQDIRFLPFMGGGRLFSLSSPNINTSVGFGGYRFFSVRGESLLNLAITYRAPIARRLALDLGPLYLEDIYWQVFTSWGNIWGYDRDGTRQVPFVDPAPNGQHILGDVGVDIRLGHFFQQLDGNVGTTLRAVYRIVPFDRCPDETDEPAPDCPGPDGDRGFLFYFLLGGGF